MRPRDSLRGILRMDHCFRPAPCTCGPRGGQTKGRSRGRLAFASGGQQPSNILPHKCHFVFCPAFEPVGFRGYFNLEKQTRFGFNARILFSFACRAMVDPQLGRGSSELVEDLLGFVVGTCFLCLWALPERARNDVFGQ